MTARLLAGTCLASVIAVVAVAVVGAPLTASESTERPPERRGPDATLPAAEPTPSESETKRAEDRGAEPSRSPRWPRVDWRESRALGDPTAGSLVGGVRVPRAGRHFFTWDPIERRSPSRPWRRWGTDGLLRLTLRTLSDYRRANPGAPRVGIGDLSRPQGGDFGPQYGIVGHTSHQNGLDIDLYYPRVDGAARPTLAVEEIDGALAQDLVDAFVEAGAERVLVGPATGLSGPPGVVEAIPGHDGHLHVRIPAAPD